MRFECRRCGQGYVVAVLGELVVFMAVEPWGKSLCAACEIDAPGLGRRRVK